MSISSSSGSRAGFDLEETSAAMSGLRRHRCNLRTQGGSRPLLTLCHRSYQSCPRVYSPCFSSWLNERSMRVSIQVKKSNESKKKPERSWRYPIVLMS
jgi:hypothetical protein